MNLKAAQRAEKPAQKSWSRNIQRGLKGEADQGCDIVFLDVEGRLHMLDYDKKFLLESLGNLTFDGSSIVGSRRNMSRTCVLKLTGRPFATFRPMSLGQAR